MITLQIQNLTAKKKLMLEECEITRNDGLPPMVFIDWAKEWLSTYKYGMVVYFKRGNIMFSKKLREIRKSKGFSQKDMATKLYVSQQAYAKYENDVSTPNPETLKKIAEIFEVSIDYLLNSNTNKFKNNKNTTDNSMITQIEDLNESSKKELEKYIELLKLKEISESNKNTTSTPTG